jgi:hypothetical protein
MGAWREKSMPGWPDISFVNLLQQSLNNRMLLGLIKGLGKRFGKEVVIQQVENNISDKSAVIFHLTWS